MSQPAKPKLAAAAGLAELQANGNLSNQELADRVGLSPSPCSRRVRQLQEARTKARALADLAIEWSIIGHLQTNKARYVARFAAEVQSLDSIKLAAALERRLCTLRERLTQEAPAAVTLEKLSMGMSGDFELAIAEGATVVRVGQALFGPRPLPDSHYWPGG